MTSKLTADLETPCLLVDADRLDANLARLQSRIDRLGVQLRPHMKTAKSIDIARRVHPFGPGPITVSTLAEAAYFAGHGYRDIIHAVGLAPQRCQRALALRASGVDLKLLLDSPAQAKALGEASRDHGVAAAALIEIDCDGHRAGVRADSAELISIADELARQGVALAGVLTHAGGSYAGGGDEAIAAAAEAERASVVHAAQRLRDRGHACPIVSVGSTPTAHFARSLDGVTEVRAGVYMMFDLVMHGIGVCRLDDIALSVLATVIGTQPENGIIIVDAGWMALSRDRGTAGHAIDQGYGLVCDEAGVPFADVIVAEANQEHGVIKLRPGSGGVLPHLPVGARVRILPNHACATAAQHAGYHVLSNDPATGSWWPRVAGW
jgi:D-serine deaminase-like pyridoxal phosphate-dependent protein